MCTVTACLLPPLHTPYPNIASLSCTHSKTLYRRQRVQHSVCADVVTGCTLMQLIAAQMTYKCCLLPAAATVQRHNAISDSHCNGRCCCCKEGICSANQPFPTFWSLYRNCCCNGRCSKELLLYQTLLEVVNSIDRAQWRHITNSAARLVLNKKTLLPYDCAEKGTLLEH